jgi:hypothetical protein
MHGSQVIVTPSRMTVRSTENSFAMSSQTGSMHSLVRGLMIGAVLIGTTTDVELVHAMPFPRKPDEQVHSEGSKSDNLSTYAIFSSFAIF